MWHRLILYFIGFGVVTTKVVAQEYHIAPELSSIKFEVTHMGLLTVEGHFATFSAQAAQYTSSETSFTVTAVILVESITTGNDSRDETIKSEGYLDTKTHPEIRFKSEGFHFREGELEVRGELTIKGESRQVKILSKGVPEKDSFRLIGSTVILRSHFNLDFGPMDALISDEINVYLEMVFEKA